MKAVTIQDMSSLGTSLKIKAGTFVHAEVAVNLPDKGWFVSPVYPDPHYWPSTDPQDSILINNWEQREFIRFCDEIV